MVNTREEFLVVGEGLKGLPDTARKIISLANGYRVWLFKGDMGAGKTTLTKAICKELGVLDNVASPTFSIINEYSSETESVYHFDFYRLKNLDEALHIGVEEYFYSGYFCFIEWPEIIKPILPDKYLTIEIIEGQEENREYKISYNDIN